MIKEETRGRPTKLTEEVMTNIKDMLLSGLSEREIFETLEIPRTTWYTWRKDNYDDFRTNVLDYKVEYKLSLAETVSEDILTTSHTAEDGKVDTGVLNVKQKESQFIRETLAKDRYSKRAEITGKDGKDLPVPIISIIRE